MGKRSTDEGRLDGQRGGILRVEFHGSIDCRLLPWITAEPQSITNAQPFVITSLSLDGRARGCLRILRAERPLVEVDLELLSSGKPWPTRLYCPTGAAMSFLGQDERQRAFDRSLVLWIEWTRSVSADDARNYREQRDLESA